MKKRDRKLINESLSEETLSQIDGGNIVAYNYDKPGTYFAAPPHGYYVVDDKTGKRLGTFVGSWGGDGDALAKAQVFAKEHGVSTNITGSQKIDFKNIRK